MDSTIHSLNAIVATTSDLLCDIFLGFEYRSGSYGYPTYCLLYTFYDMYVWVYGNWSGRQGLTIVGSV